MSTPSRNSACPCGSGKKYKRCCGKGEPGLVAQLPDSQPLTREQLTQARQLELAGEHEQALQLYEVYLASHPRHPALLWGHGRCCMELGLERTACRSLLAASSSVIRDEKMAVDITRRLLVLGRPDAVLDLYDRVGKQFPNNIRLKGYRAEALSHQGQHNKALPLYRKYLNARPEGSRIPLIRILRHTGRNSEAIEVAQNRLRQLQGSAHGFERGWLLQELSQSTYQAGDYGESFALAKESGQILLDTPEYRSINSNVVLSALDAFSEHVGIHGLPDVSSNVGERDRKLVFQLGFPRSGTTLLESLIGTFPGVTSSDEAPLVDTAIAVGYSQGYGDLGILQALAQGKPELVKAARSAFWAHVDREYGDAYSTLLVKQPFYTMYLPQIRLLFPGARIIFCVRDPRDICLSCFMQWFTPTDLIKQFLDIETTAHLYEKFMTYWQRIEPHLKDSVCKVRYEDLIQDPEVHGARIANFLGKSWEPGMLKAESRMKGKHFRTPSNQGVRGELNSSAVGRWQNFTEELEPVMPILEPFLKHFGYE